MMAATLAVPESMAESVTGFLEAQAISLSVVAGSGGTVRVVKADERQESSPYLLQAGGWITCGIARSMAATLNISSGNMGALLNHLNIRIRACELGCFE